MKFSVKFMYDERVEDVGEMTVIEANAFIAMLGETSLAEGYRYLDHFFDIKDKTFYIEVG